MRSGPSSIQLRLFGRVSWVIDGDIVPVAGGRPAEIASLLALRRHSWMSVDALMDELWVVPPGSRANAVQRHVSRLRRQLVELGGPDPSAIVEWSPAGYRLGPALVTDLDLLDSDGAGGPPAGPVAWWETPLSDIDPDRLRMVRAALVVRAERHRRRWAAREVAGGDAETALTWLLDRSTTWSGDPDMTRLVLELAEAVDEGPARRQAAELVSASALETEAGGDLVMRASSIAGRRGALRAPFDYRVLASCGTAVLHDDAEAAFAAFESMRELLPDRVASSVVRWLVWTPADDGFTKVIWREVIGFPEAMAAIAERAAAALDAFAFEHMDQPRHEADGEVAAAHDADELVRALRVRFMVGLGHPIDQAQRDVVDRLFELDHPAAQVEAPRFAALLAIKQRRTVEALRWLDSTAEAAEREWPQAMDDADVLARAVLSAAWPDLVDEPKRAVLPIATNQDTLDIVRLTQIVLTDRSLDVDGVAELDDLRHHAHRCMSIEAARAYDVLTARRLGRHEEEAVVAAELAATWLRTPPNRHRHIGLVALGLHAEDRGDRDLARSVTAALEPWSGEELGVWPLDVLLGSADEWSQRFAAI